jgi:hypothetical protein
MIHIFTLITIFWKFYRNSFVAKDLQKWQFSLYQNCVNTWWRKITLKITFKSRLVSTDSLMQRRSLGVLIPDRNDTCLKFHLLLILGPCVSPTLLYQVCRCDMAASFKYCWNKGVNDNPKPIIWVTSGSEDWALPISPFL